ncbi:MAG: preprotein translocase subunit SecA [Clostridiales bacterium]|nr:preprotein translocase subunit SecA [Clostridiales bacterium]
MGFIDKMFKSFNEREIKKMMNTAEEIVQLEEKYISMTDIELKDMTDAFRERLLNGETLDDLLVDAFAVVREASKRTIGLVHYPVQLVGGIVLHQGRIAEMKTGEGKTLVATLAVYLNALEGKGVHVVTVNDYLAARDKEWMGKIYEFLGMSVGVITNDIKGEQRANAYNADITYGTNNEFGFDYLRDNMAIFKKDRFQRGLNYAIIDEVDSILIDEARTPLIISGPGKKSTNMYKIADMFAQTLKNEVDVTIDEKAKSVILTEEIGIGKAEKYFAVENITDPSNLEIFHHINQALRARFIMKRDVDYVVKDGQVLIVDEFTGRLMNGRRYSSGLHQAIEAKEGIEIRKESQTLATITLQNYFRMYNKLSGMTGTAKTEEEEFKEIYNMDVLVIPTNKPVIREDHSDIVYKSLQGKFKHVIEEIEEKHLKGQPMLVGTISIETSEYLSKLLKQKGIKHKVLNAKHHDQEAEIVSQAGRFGSVTIATNMAGRGTDIVLGGNADHLAKKELLKKGYESYVVGLVDSKIESDDEEVNNARKEYNQYLKKYKEVIDQEAEKVKAVGGLHIIGTERHESRRIDNQLRGRSGRQGDAGSSRFYLSLEDDLLRLFMGDNAKVVLDKFGLDEDMPIEAKILTKSIEGAQKKVEGRNFGIRKHVLQYDDVINKQRTIIYNERNKVLEGENLKEHIWNMIDEIVSEAIEIYTANSKFPEEWDLEALNENLHQYFLPKNSLKFDNIEDIDKEILKDKIMDFAEIIYKVKEEEIGLDRVRELERMILLRIVDNQWIDHIDAMDQLKQGIGLRAIGNENPVTAYQIEGFQMFGEMIENIKKETVRFVYNVQVNTTLEKQNVNKISEKKVGPVAKKVKIGRNDPCPCGSGLKYKKCCGRNL